MFTLSGLIAWVLLNYEKPEQNLLTVRKIQRQPDLFAETIEAMKNEDRCGGLCQTGASAAYAKEGGYFVSNAEKNTRWLDSQAMQDALGESTFDMDALKWGKASLFLVLPSKYLKQHGRFLRLFVRMAIETMQTERDGEIRGTDCLFLLDEFFALGYIDEIATTAGLMAGYGLKLWPILQDIEQLNKLYGQDGAATFFGSADLHQFFGNMDAPTLRYVSERIGNYNVEDMPSEPLIDLRKYDKMYAEFQQQKGSFFYSPVVGEGTLKAAGIELKFAQDVYQDNLSKFNTEVSRVLGKPRISPDQLSPLIKKPESGPAQLMIAIVHGGEPILVRLAPYYLEGERAKKVAKAKQKSLPQHLRKFVHNDPRLKRIDHALARFDRSSLTRSQKTTLAVFDTLRAHQMPDDQTLDWTEAILEQRDHRVAVPDRWTKRQLQKGMTEWFPPSGSKGGAIARARTSAALWRIHRMQNNEPITDEKKLAAIGRFFEICEKRYAENSEVKALNEALN